VLPKVGGLGGASLNKGKPLDGVDVWSALSDGKPSPRHEVVYNIEPFRGGVREGDWKLIWRTPLPSALELYNIAQDPGEKTNLAEKNPELVAKLQKRIEELARESAKSLFLWMPLLRSRPLRTGRLRCQMTRRSSPREIKVDVQPCAAIPLRFEVRLDYTVCFNTQPVSGAICEVL